MTSKSVKPYAIPVYSIRLVREKGLKVSEDSICAPELAAQVVRSYIGLTDREHFVALLLDTRNHIIGLNTVTVGTLNGSLVHPRELFKPAILSNAAAVILAHNHPGGDPEPSREDISVTRMMQQAGKILGIEVLDHIIVTLEGKYVSLKAHGYLN